MSASHLRSNANTLEDIRQFLRRCRGVSDKELFGKEDYWQPPEEFEKRKAGDCEDFSLWTWRQLLSMGLNARVVFGRHGRYGIGHAWVMFFQEGKCFLVEPQARGLGLRLPRLSTLHYEPKYSVAWNGEELKYYAHKDRCVHHLPWRLLIALIPEWTNIWGGSGSGSLFAFPSVWSKQDASRNVLVLSPAANAIFGGCAPPV